MFYAIAAVDISKCQRQFVAKSDYCGAFEIALRAPRECPANYLYSNSTHLFSELHNFAPGDAIIVYNDYNLWKPGF